MIKRTHKFHNSPQKARISMKICGNFVFSKTGWVGGLQNLFEHTKEKLIRKMKPSTFEADMTDNFVVYLLKCCFGCYFHVSNYFGFQSSPTTAVAAAATSLWSSCQSAVFPLLDDLHHFINVTAITAPAIFITVFIYICYTFYFWQSTLLLLPLACLLAVASGGGC